MNLLDLLVNEELNHLTIEAIESRAISNPYNTELKAILKLKQAGFEPNALDGLLPTEELVRSDIKEKLIESNSIDSIEKAFLNAPTQLSDQNMEPIYHNKESELLDWVESNLEWNDVKSITELPKSDEVKKSIITKLKSEPDVKSSFKEVVIKDKKLKKAKLELTVVNEVPQDDFSNWLLQFSSIRGGNLSKFEKLKKKERKKNKTARAAELSIVKSKQLVSEPLARLLATQGHFAKAIEMYEQLILNFPEKSAYFALQIKKLKNKE